MNKPIIKTKGKASRPIKKRLTSINLVISFIVVIAATTIFVSNYVYTHKRILTENLFSVGHLVESIARAPLVFQDANAGLEGLISLNAIRYVQYAAIYDERKQLFAEYGKTDEFVGMRISSDLDVDLAQMEELKLPVAGNQWLPDVAAQFFENTVTLRLPIALNNEVLGVLYITADIQLLASEILWILSLSLWVLLATVALSYIMSSRPQGLRNLCLNLRPICAMCLVVVSIDRRKFPIPMMRSES